MITMLKRAQKPFFLLLLILFINWLCGCKREQNVSSIKPEAPEEYYVVSDSFETIYKAMTNPNHTEIDKYNIWASYRGKKVRWAADFISAKVDKKNVKVMLAVIYDNKQKRLIAGVEALFDSESGKRLLKELAPNKKIVFEGVIANYRYTQDGAFIIGVSSARLVD